MSEKMECMGCDAYNSSVLSDYRNGEPCRFCGLPHEAATAIKAARRSSADKALIEQYEAAITRATRAEADSARFASLLDDMRRLVERYSKPEGGE